MNKMSQYISTLEITKGFFIALLGSSFIYLNHWGLSSALVHSILGLLSLYLLLPSSTKTWFWYGCFIALFWFWWIGLSLEHYGYHFIFPFAVAFISLVYGLIFLVISWSLHKLAKLYTPQRTLILLILKSIAILLLSYFHPFGFDWLKPELMFVQSYLGILKWEFAIILLTLVLMLWRKNILYFLLIFTVFQTPKQIQTTIPNNIAMISTHIKVKEKWDKTLHAKQFEHFYTLIDKAIEQNKTLIIFPESVFPIFINHDENVFNTLEKKSNHINIIAGGLYWDGKKPKNSTYIFTKNKVTVANKVVLVPFGESNPLPNFLSHWVNKVFYDGAVDYVSSPYVTDYKIGNAIYRNAICFEATSEKLYEKNKQGEHPKNMIVISNNAWFTPSIEPTLQKLLLLYYHRKYGTTIYHSINMGQSYIIK